LAAGALSWHDAESGTRYSPAVVNAVVIQFIEVVVFIGVLLGGWSASL